MNGDLVSMIGNLSRSLIQVEALVSGFGYVIGILLMIAAIIKLKRVSGSSGEGMFGPVAFFVVGTALVFLPSMLGTLSSTAFGNSNILQYIEYDPFNIYNSMAIIIQCAGLIWFVRGCVLLAHGSEPGAEEGPKGFVFIIAGIFAMNFQGTIGVLNYIMGHLLTLTGFVSGQV